MESNEPEDLLKEELEDRQNVTDADDEEISFAEQFSITSYGADYNVDSLVKRVRSGAFFKPSFQREYVWSQKQASRFIESLLLGLPVPGLFVYRTEGSKHLIIDGLQRLTTLERFYTGLFGKKEFNLIEVRDRWKERSYQRLDEEDRLRLDDAIIHTTVFKQDYPDDNNDSIYEVFERINTGGLKLSPQEIRICVNYVEDTEASFAALLRTLNQTLSWRDIYGAPSVRLKDQELILRFLALKEGLAGYKRPLRGFLDRFMAKHKSLTQDQQNTFTKDFCSVIDQIHGALGKRAFRPETSLNAAVFDAVMIGVFRRINAGAIRQVSTLVGQYDALIKNEQFQSAFKRSTADETQLGNRVRIATSYFSKVV